MSQSYNDLQAQRFLFYSLFPEVHSENQGKPSTAPSPSQPSRGQNKPSLSPGQPSSRLGWCKPAESQHPPSPAAWAGSAPHLPSIPFPNLGVRRTQVCQAWHREQELPFALLHGSWIGLLLVQTSEFSSAAVVPPESYSWLPSDLPLSVPSLPALCVSMHMAKEARHIWECLSEHLSAMWATETPGMWRK